MSEYYESIADRWVREYERKHSEVLVKVPKSDQEAADEGSFYSISLRSTSEPVKKAVYPSLEASNSKAHLYREEIDPIVRAARETRLRLKLSQRVFARGIGIRSYCQIWCTASGRVPV